ncbi:MAG: hypothetical protein DRI36_04765 [Caldiserica bacterium]|nr:MAG: hypothetical protein DRI36_04765 [Caldisericota bacterium]
MERYAIWLITGKCNLSCKHCYASIYRNRNELSLKDIEKVANNLKNIRVKRVGLTGGEPTLRKDITKICDILFKNNIIPDIQTNLINLNEELIDYVKEKNIHLYTSIESTKKEIQDRIRGEGIWKRIIENHEKIAKIGISFSPVVVITSLNENELLELVKLAYNIGARKISFLPLIPQGKAKENWNELKPSTKSLRMFLEKVNTLADDIKFNVHLFCMPFAEYFRYSEYISVSPCYDEDVIDISPEGDIIFCDVLDEKISSLIEDKPEDALKKLRESDTVRISEERKEKVKECKNCKVIDFCKAGCPARAYLTSKDYFKIDPLCPLNK